MMFDHISVEITIGYSEDVGNEDYGFSNLRTLVHLEELRLGPDIQCFLIHCWVWFTNILFRIWVLCSPVRLIWYKSNIQFTVAS